jgi:hypothetical protein
MEKLIINGECVSEGPEFWAVEREKYLKEHHKRYYNELEGQGILETVVKSTGKNAYNELVYRMENGFRKHEALEFVNEIVYKHNGGVNVGGGGGIFSQLLNFSRSVENGTACDYDGYGDIFELLEAARDYDG